VGRLGCAPSPPATNRCAACHPSCADVGAETFWLAGNSNDVFAYIPSLRVLHEGGYEGGGAMIPYGQPASFGTGVEEIIIEKVADLMRKTAG
jgi:neutral ceramidase